jgi:hypothetical protein
MYDLVPANRPAPRAVARHHYRGLDRIDRAAELAAAQVDALADVTEHAIVRSAMVQRTRAMAEQIAPDGAEVYALLSFTSAAQMTSVIRHMGR